MTEGPQHEPLFHFDVSTFRRCPLLDPPIPSSLDPSIPRSLDPSIPSAPRRSDVSASSIPRSLPPSFPRSPDPVLLLPLAYCPFFPETDPIFRPGAIENAVCVKKTNPIEPESRGFTAQLAARCWHAIGDRKSAIGNYPITGRKASRSRPGRRRSRCRRNSAGTPRSREGRSRSRRRGRRARSRKADGSGRK